MSAHACNQLCYQGELLHWAQKAIGTDDPEKIHQWCEQVLRELDTTL